MNARVRVLILGGYGAFGGRLARLLADEPRLSLLIAGRSRAKAVRFIGGLGGQAAIGPAELDRDGDVAAQIAKLRPDVVVDCTGPFQGYGAEKGSDPYRVARAAIAEGAHYLDLADAPDFVRGIGGLDAEAKRARVFALSGASTTPALTHAVVRRLTEDLVHVDRISCGITPSPHARMGASVIAAVTACAGRPVRLVKDGEPATATGLLDSRRATIAPPGAVPLSSTRFSLVDAPDLTLLPELFPGVRQVWFGAGIRPPVLHRLLNAAAWLRSKRLLPPLTRLAPLMEAAHRLFRWGEHRSGMFVSVDGRDAAGRSRLRAWHVLAEGDEGPFIPAMAAAALIRKLLDGAPPAPGARPATSDVTLADYEAAFASRAIAAGVREDDDSDPSRPLYRRVLGSAWSAVPEPIRRLHDVRTRQSAAGVARVERGGGLVARMIAGAIRFPEAGERVPLRVDFSVVSGVERWTRTFAGRSFTSWQHAGSGRDVRLLVEWFGPLAFLLALELEEGGRLRLQVRGWRLFGLGMPRWLAPSGDAYEHAEDGRFHFHVELRHPLAGLIVRYQGWLELEGAVEEEAHASEDVAAVN